jgi:ATP-dependent phosphofructokinase / diphosphate-dependent phosphofructokinase
VSAGARNLLVLQGGGPTPVLNASLFGVIEEAARSGRFNRILGARFGIEGLIKNDLIDLSSLSQSHLQKLRTSPGASLGSTRTKASDTDLELILQNLGRNNIRALIVIGGNGSLRGAQAISDAADICVIGVPKTIDNDIPSTDRCPGYASAARYVAQSVRDLGMDVRALPQPVSIYETMGRSVGWLAAASVLSKLDEDHAPHLVYLPERPFDPQRFLADIDTAVRRHGWAVAVVTEGIKTPDGRPVFEMTTETQRDALNRALPGGVGAYLADMVTSNLKIRCRSEMPGLCGRASMLHVSQQDLVDAELVGRAGVRAALEDRKGTMISLRPLGNDGPTEVIPLSSAAGGERTMPEEFLDGSPHAVSQKFLSYIRPLVGDLIDYAVPLTTQRQTS